MRASSIRFLALALLVSPAAAQSRLPRDLDAEVAWAFGMP